MKCIAAVDANWSIGYQNQLLYHIPNDMEFFKKTTLGKTVIMGRNTYKSLKRPLPERKANIILTSHSIHTDTKNVKIYADLNELLTEYTNDSDAFVIGGESLYKQCLPYCDTAYITKIYEQKPADTHFPDLDKHPDWTCIEEGPLRNYNGTLYRFCTYQNQNTKTIASKGKSHEIYQSMHR